MENCPAVDDCYMLEKKSGCCEKCKGKYSTIVFQWSLSINSTRIKLFIYISRGKFTECVHDGERYASGAEWVDADDPCTSYKCVAGVVTESNIQCYTPCNNPLLPRTDQCCSTCMGELLFNQLLLLVCLQDNPFFSVIAFLHQ